MNALQKLRFIFSRKQKIKLLILAIMIIVGAVLELVGVTAIAPFITVAMEPGIIQKNELLFFCYNFCNSQSANEFLALLAILLIIIYIVKNIYLIVMNYCIYRFTYNNQRMLATRLLSAYLKQPYSFFVYNNSAELMRNINIDTSMLFDTVLSSMQLAVEIIVCTFLATYLMITDKSITIGVSVLLIGFVYLFVKVFKRNLKDRGQRERLYKGSMDRWLLQAFGGIKETKIMERETFFLKRYNEQHTKFAENHCVYQVLSYLPKPVMETLCIGGVLIVIALKLMRNVNSGYFISTLSVFAVAAMRLLPAFNRIMSYTSRIMFNKSGVDAVYEDLKELDRLEKENNSKSASDKAHISFNTEINVEDISFRYPNTENYILKNASLCIPKNKSVALIGPSGTGKTTLVDIILGVLQPESGKITVDGVDIENNMSLWHQRIGYIPQTIYLLDDTIEKNVAFAIEDNQIDQIRLRQAIEEAQLGEFIDSLEEGIHTQIGERGVRLSGGQRQRIGIARALYANPEVLVLDEATSALDNDTETAVMDAINSLAGKKTLIIIAHRLTTIKDCDYIYEVKNQQIIETKINL